MKFKYEELIPVKVTPCCEIEGCNGVMIRSSDFVYSSYPAQYDLKCNKCGNTIRSHVSGSQIKHMTREEFELLKPSN